MTRTLVVLLGLLLLSLPAASQQVPDPLSRSELNTVKSEGGAPGHGVITRFYDDYGNVQFQVNSNPVAYEIAIEQAGMASGTTTPGQGPTRFCWAPTMTGGRVNCNYMASGVNGTHVFGSGAGLITEFQFEGVGPPTGWPRLVSTDASTARIEAAGSATGEIGLELKPQGGGSVFVAPAVGTGALEFRAAAGDSVHSIIRSTGHGVAIYGQRFNAHKAHGISTITYDNSGEHFHNWWDPGDAGAVPPIPSDGTPGPTTLTLPPAVRGWVGVNYCFSVQTAQLFTIQADGTDKIAIGATNSIAGGKISSNQLNASVCIELNRPGQWITHSVVDKAQWTVL